MAMDRCLTVELNNTLENVTLNPKEGDYAVVSEPSLSGEHGNMSLNSFGNGSIDGVENPSAAYISSLDWNKRHVIVFHDKYTRTSLRIGGNYAADNPIVLHTKDFLYFRNLSALDINFSGFYQKLKGSLSDFKNAANGYMSLVVPNSEELVGDVASIFNANTHTVQFGFDASRDNITCDMSDFTSAPLLQRFSISYKEIEYSDAELRASKDFVAIACDGFFKTDADADNYLIATSKCRWNGKLGRGYYDMLINIKKENYTPSSDALAAIQYLKSNMFLNQTDTERTSGTYFTVKINGVAQ